MRQAQGKLEDVDCLTKYHESQSYLLLMPTYGNT